MIHTSKAADERREAGALECWCLHGAVGSAGDWRRFTGALAGHGMSSVAVDLWRFLDGGPLPLAEFGRALNAEAAALKQRPRVLIGYSMGGRLGLHALLANPGCWQAAVIVSAHPGLEDAAERAARRAADAAWANLALTATWQEFLDRWHVQDIFRSASPIRDPTADRQLAARRREIARSFVDWSLGAQEPLWEQLAGIRVPVLWVAGGNDPKFHGLARRATELMPCATLAAAPQAGHRVPWEAEDWLFRKTIEFLANPDRPPAC